MTRAQLRAWNAKVCDQLEAPADPKAVDALVDFIMQEFRKEGPMWKLVLPVPVEET